jgi:hypothetical protein
MNKITATTFFEFDKKFVFAAVVIGFTYALAIVLIGNLVGKEAAGVAGVSLTALAVGIFQRFETLRFKTVATRELQLDVSAFSKWGVLLLFFCFFGTQFIFGLIIGLLLAPLELIPTISKESGADIFDFMTDSRVLIYVYIVTGLAYFFTAFVSAKAIIHMTYGHALIAALVTLIFSSLITLLPVIIQNPEEVYMSEHITSGIFWLVYLGAVMLGVRCGRRREIVNN